MAGAGGPAPQPKLDCIPQAQRDAIEAAIAANPVTPRGPHPLDGGPAPYPFQPIAGTVWQDRFIFNFVDLDSSSGILDWDCTDFTYDGHSGHDLTLRHFGEEDVGVPIFAALDGTVMTAPAILISSPIKTWYYFSHQRHYTYSRSPGMWRSYGRAAIASSGL